MISQMLVILLSLTRASGLHMARKRTNKADSVCNQISMSAHENGTCKNGTYVFSNGLKFCNETIIDSQRERYEEENLHEPEESKIFYSIIRRSGSNDIFVDVGAACGYYALWAMKIAPSLNVWAFNPSSYFQAQLANNALLNFPGKDGKHALEHLCQDFRAVTLVDGDVMHIENEYGSKVTNAGNGTSCETVSWSTWESQSGVQTPYLVMTDIQGGEREVVPVIVSSGHGPSLLTVGTHGADIHIEVRKSLQDNGYTVLYDKDAAKFSPDGIIVAVKSKWSRAAEFQKLAKNFANETMMDLPFHEYKDAEKSW